MKARVRIAFGCLAAISLGWQWRPITPVPTLRDPISYHVLELSQPNPVFVIDDQHFLVFSEPAEGTRLRQLLEVHDRATERFVLKYQSTYRVPAARCPPFYCPLPFPGHAMQIRLKAGDVGIPVEIASLEVCGCLAVGHDRVIVDYGPLGKIAAPARTGR